MQAKRRTWVTRYMVVHLALHSGLRVSEMAALNVSDLHFSGNENYLATGQYAKLQPLLPVGRKTLTYLKMLYFAA
ncbi:MAG: hypothetical protein A4E65_00209 [Syntrophorhabdus sp. PtaU1.Bin153]|nr:MAG: hypothetical protein A4E65_00209 [Syntrophorhabdus sp. PtaU1.Bin153]